MNSSLFNTSENSLKTIFTTAFVALTLSACGGNEHTGVSGSITPTPTPSSCPGQCFASGFATSLTTENGSLGTYAYINASYDGVAPDGSYWYGGVAPSTPPSSNPYPFMGIFAGAPGITASGGNDTGTPLVVVTPNIKLSMSIGQEVWNSTNGTAQVRIVLQGKGNKYSFNGGSNNCTALIYKDVPLTSQAMTSYSFALSSFTVGYTVGNGSASAPDSCGQSALSSPAAVVADGVAELHLQLLGPGNMNTTVLSNGTYPSGLTFGAPIYFQ